MNRSSCLRNDRAKNGLFALWGYTVSPLRMLLVSSSNPDDNSYERIQFYILCFMSKYHSTTV